MTDVLIVDDDPAITEMVGEALALEGIPHRAAGNGHEALALLAEHRPRLILLDINMPVMDGVAFCGALDDGQSRDGIALVVMTAARDAQRFREMCAADDVLGKPFHLDDLYAVVRRYMTRGGSDATERKSAG